jgi:hypothetical protein
MRLLMTTLAAFLLTAAAPAQSAPPLQAARPPVSSQPDFFPHYPGFDRNDYPGDSTLPALRRRFSFTGYWLNNPPGEQQNNWQGKRDVLLRAGFGFLVLFNGRLDAEIVKAQKSGTSPSALGKADATAAIAAAHREHFPNGAILFLDQEEGGRLLAEQADYLFAWTEAVAGSGYRPGVYASGQPVNEGHGHTITTAEDIRSHVATGHLHEITLWVAQDACPPSNGCTLQPAPPDASGTPNAAAWQYAQSPRRKSITAACARTYAADGNCYVPGVPGLFLDLDTAASPDPSHGR